VIYGERLEVIMEEESLKRVIIPMIRRTIARIVQVNTQGQQEEWNLQHILDFAHASIVHPDDLSIEELENKSPQQIEELLFEEAEKIYRQKEEDLNGKEQMLEFEKVIILRVVD